MCGQIGGYKGITELTMAFFVDSGWYSINTKGWKHDAHIGKNKGCTFITDKCVASDGSIAPAHDDYCPTRQQAIPDFTGLGCGYCGVTSLATDSTLPSHFNYWGDNSLGMSGLADNCPFALSYSNRICADSDMKTNYASGSSGWTDSVGYPGFYGKYGICASSTLIEQGYTSPTANYSTCLKGICSKDNNNVDQITITVHRNAASTEQVICLKSEVGQVKTISGSSYVKGTITCPDVNKLCVKYN